jgi:hypothetical protein
MSDPKQQHESVQHPESNELELVTETVTDLEPSTEIAEVIRGGRCVQGCGRSVEVQSQTN